MKPQKFFILILFLFLSIMICKSQETFFNEYGIDKTFLLKKKASIDVATSIKFQIKTDAKWKQYYLGAEWDKSFNERWKGLIGLNNYYTTQDNGENYYEIRPYVGIMLYVPAFKNLTMQQRFKYEVRNNIFKEKSNDFIQNRTRFMIAFDYKLNGKHPEKLNYWSINSGFEWYFVKQPNASEQFSASREFHFSATKRTKKNSNFTLNYQFDIINVFTAERAADAHTVTFTYSF